MTFNFIKLPELDFDLKAETTESGRKYVTPNGARYPSVTTVLSSYNKKAIMEWRQRVGAEVSQRTHRYYLLLGCLGTSNHSKKG
jgi:hypothetical protein